MSIGIQIYNKRVQVKTGLSIDQKKNTSKLDKFNLVKHNLIFIK